MPQCTISPWHFLAFVIYALPFWRMEGGCGPLPHGESSFERLQRAVVGGRGDNQGQGYGCQPQLWSGSVCIIHLFYFPFPSLLLHSRTAYDIYSPHPPKSNTFFLFAPPLPGLCIVSVFRHSFGMRCCRSDWPRLFFFCFVVINPRVLSANRVDSWLHTFLCFINFRFVMRTFTPIFSSKFPSFYPPPPLPDLRTSSFKPTSRL